MRGQIEQALRQMPEYDRLKENIRLSVTGEGLRVELLETETGLFFVAGSAEPAEAGQHLLRTLAGELARLPNTLIIEGHTDARPFRNAAPSKGYSNWELSADRANAARRLLHQWGVRPGQIVEVRGFAEENPIDAAQPNNPRNRRVSIVVRFEPSGGLP
jgi:chemotaxis protein MotB